MDLYQKLIEITCKEAHQDLSCVISAMGMYLLCIISNSSLISFPKNPGRKYNQNGKKSLGSKFDQKEGRIEAALVSAAGS